MSVATEQGVATLDPERLRYVTRSVLVLQSQGLNAVALGAAFFLFGIQNFFKGSPFSWWLTIAAVAALVATGRYIPKYYQRRFGTVESPNLTNKQFVVVLSVFLALVFFGRTVGRFADSFPASASDRLHAAISDPGHRVSLLPVVFWLLFLCFDLIGRPFLESPEHGMARPEFHGHRSVRPHKSGASAAKEGTGRRQQSH